MENLHPKSVWLFFFRSLLIQLFLFLYFGAILVLIAIEKGFNFVYGFLLLALFFLLFIAFDYLWAILSYRFYGYELMEDNLRIERGIIWKRYISIPYEKIQNVDIYRGVIARILGLSELRIQTAGFSFSFGPLLRGLSEGNLPGLSIEKAEQLREELISRVKGTKQGL